MYSQPDDLEYYDEDFEEEPQKVESKILFQNSFVGYQSTSFILETIYHYLKKITQDYGLSEGVTFKLLNLNHWKLEKTENYINDRYSFPEYENIKVEPYCPICCEDLSPANREIMVCGHTFCQDCFRAYILEVVKEGPGCLSRTCPKSGCKEILGPSLFRKYLFDKNKEEFNKYEKFLIDNFVMLSDTLKWCPGKDCKQAVDLEASKIMKFTQKNIKCECGCSFCMACEKEAHMPASCERFANWQNLIMGKNTKVDELWLQIHTKKCPQCKVNIEKNMGCMHMTCKNCGYEFCWLCLGDWKGSHGAQTGGFYACNIYKEDSAQSKKLSESEKEINRMNFYIDRYQQHQASLRKAEEKKKAKFDEFKAINKKMKTQEDLSMVADSLDLIVECRRCISYTYVIAYYLGSEKKEFFEFLQAELERNLEILDEMTDENFEKLFESSKIYVNWKTKLKNFKDVLKNYSENVLSDLEKNLPELQVLEKKKSLITGKTISFLDSQIEQDTHWYCMYCTYANGQERIRCEMCNNQRATNNNE